jgi:alpha-beta hydrolase superfamily lysophospholipase
MPFSMGQRASIISLSTLAPRRLARVLLRPQPQPMTETLATSGWVEPVAFATGGDVCCRGWWVTPASGPQPDRCVVLAHGWTSHALRLAHLVDPLLDAGFAVLLYNSRGHGNSDYYPISSLAQFTEDLHHAIGYALQRAQRAAVIGHSLGGAATLVAAADGAPIEAAIALAAPAHPLQAAIDVLTQEGVPGAWVMERILTYVEELIGRSFDSMAPELLVRDIQCPVLLVHGTADQVISFEHFQRILHNAGPNVMGCPVEGADHDAVKFAPQTLEAIQRFLGRTLGGASSDLLPASSGDWSAFPHDEET